MLVRPFPQRIVPAFSPPDSPCFLALPFAARFAPASIQENHRSLGGPHHPQSPVSENDPRDECAEKQEPNEYDEPRYPVRIPSGSTSRCLLLDSIIRKGKSSVGTTSTELMNHQSN